MYSCPFLYICSFVHFKGVVLMDMLWSMVLKLSGNTMDVNIMDVNASMTIPMNTFIFNKNGLSEKQNWKLMVAKLLKWNAVNGENNWDIFDEILRKPNLDEFYVLIIRNILHFAFIQGKWTAVHLSKLHNLCSISGHLSTKCKILPENIIERNQKWRNFWIYTMWRHITWSYDR